MNRKSFLLASLGLAGCSRGPVARGCHELAGQSIRWIVPYPPGGSYDVYSRLIEAPFEKALGAEILIANEPGAGGLVGSAKIRDAAPDGRTMGILSSPGLLFGALAGQQSIPNPVKDFTILGCIARQRSLLVTGARSGMRTVEDLVERQKSKTLIGGASGAASNSLYSCSITANLLGLNAKIVTGFGGSREELLALMRGEIDFLVSNNETVQAPLDAGDVLPVLQVADAAVASHSSLAACPFLTGAEGWAALRASASGRTREQAVADAGAFVDVIAAGIVAVAPARLPDELKTCLRAKFMAAVSEPTFVQAASAARRTLQISDGAQAEAWVNAAEKKVGRFERIVRQAVEGTRK
jgi:tripartite-type tricarboxylate transporter receptor subunit TctC